MELFAVKCGESLYESRFVFHDDDLHTKLSFHWLFYAVKFRGRTILVDTGFPGIEGRERYGIAFTDPFASLRSIGIEADDVTDVIVTHAHWDHIGNVHRFKHAVVHIQKDELNACLGRPSDGNAASFLAGNPNVRPFVDSAPLYGAFHIKRIGGHSIGSSVVTFACRGKRYILTGDECYLPENYLGGRPVGNIFDYERNAAFVRSLRRSYDFIFTFHDPAVAGDMPVRRLPLGRLRTGARRARADRTGGAAAGRSSRGSADSPGGDERNGAKGATRA